MAAVSSLLDEVKHSLPHLVVRTPWLESFTGISEYQLLLDLALVAIIVYILLKHAIVPEKPLTAKEQQELLDEWTPEPLKPELTPQMKLDDKIPAISKTTTTHVTINKKDVLNLVRTNWLGFIGNKQVEETAAKAVQKYGTGTCGPRGFYGTIDVHLNLEKRIRDFLGSEDCVIYSFGFATVSSVIPAFSGRGDLLVVDDGVSYAVQTGVKLSRSEVLWFKHNDMQDLERVLKQVQAVDKKKKRKLNRRFIVIEGLYVNFGDVVPLPQIMALKEKYKYRIMLDDSYGIGVLGKTGRGVCEHFGVDVRQVELLTGSLEPITSSVGGFCCGDKGIVYHQRLNSSGYVYSCSLPPLLAAASITALDIIDAQPQLLEKLHKSTTALYKGLSTVGKMVVTSQPNSPVIHLRLRNPPQDRLQDETLLQNIVDEALNGGVFITRARYVHSLEHNLPAPSIRIAVSAAFTEQHVQTAIAVLKAAAEKALANLPVPVESSVSSTKQLKERSTIAPGAAGSGESPSSSPAQSPAAKKKKKKSTKPKEN